MRVRERCFVLALGAVVLLAPTAARCAAAIECAVNVLPDGQVQVLLDTGAAVFAGASPQASVGGATIPAGVPAASRTQEIRDALGDGVQHVIEFERFTWQITVYQEQPFFTAQVYYRNTTEKPVRIGSLTPWVASASCSLGSGTNSAAILDNGTLTEPAANLWMAETANVSSLWSIAAFNRENSRSLIAGFLTSARAYPMLSLRRGEDDVFARFVAENLYTPPVTLAPGEALASEVLYLGVGHIDPLQGLESFARCVAQWNDLRPTRRALPHGWDSWVAHYHSDIHEDQMLVELEVAARELKRYGWTHFSIDDGWQKKAGEWEADPERFPSGMKAMADAIHAKGMTAGLWTEPFTVNIATPVAKAHPDWLRPPNLMGMALMGADEGILDVTVPDAADFLRGVYKTIADDWGYDALVETDFLYHMLATDGYAQANVTNPEALAEGMQTIRSGAGAKTFIMGVAPFPIVGMYVDGMRAGVDCAPLWRKSDGGWAWGCVNTLTNASRRYYLSPGVVSLDQDCAFFGHNETRKRWNVEDQPKLTRDQQIAWMTGAALTGGAVKIGDAFSLLTPEEFDVLRRLLPVADHPARPIDLFERKEPRIWSLPIRCEAGDWQVVAVFNWDANRALDERLSLAALGLDPEKEYAVFDFWKNTYKGAARGDFDLVVSPGSVCLMNFRELQPHPMFLAIDSHISQGATDIAHLQWSENERALTGTLRAIESTEYLLSFRVPENFAVSAASIGNDPLETHQEGELLQCRFRSGRTSAEQWRIAF